MHAAHPTLALNVTGRGSDARLDKVAGGLYGSASEVVREALRLMQEQDQLRAIKLEQLRADIRAAIESGSAGEPDVAAIKRRGRERLAKMTKP